VAPYQVSSVCGAILGKARVFLHSVHADIEGNEVADKQVKRVAQNLAAAVRFEPNIMKFTSISH
jgi:hypothetical protein